VTPVGKEGPENDMGSHLHMSLISWQESTSVFDASVTCYPAVNFISLSLNFLLSLID
jgi:hypothetical protein